MIFIDSLCLKSCLLAYKLVKANNLSRGNITVQVLDPIKHNFKSRFLQGTFRLCGIELKEAEFFAGYLRGKDGENIWTASEKALNNIASIAAENSLQKFKLFNKLNDTWGRQSIKLYLIKYFVGATRYGGDHTIFKIMIADALSNLKYDEKHHLLLNLPFYFTSSLFEEIKGSLELHTYSLRSWSIKKTRVSVFMLIAYALLKHLKQNIISNFHPKQKFGDFATPALLLSQEDDLSFDRSYRGQPHWLFKDSNPPAFRTLILENTSGTHQINDMDKLEQFGVYNVPKETLYFNFPNNSVKKNICSTILKLLIQSLFGSRESIEISFRLVVLFIKAFKLAGFCESQNVKAYMTCENYLRDAEAMYLISKQMGIHIISYQYSNLSYVSPLLQNTSDTMCTFSHIFRKRWEENGIKPNSYVNIGYLFDSSFNLVKERAQFHRKELEKHGANFIIGYYDESVQSRGDKYGIISEDDNYNEILALIKFAINNNDVAVIIKSQFNRNTPKLLYRNDSYMKNVVKTNRFLDLHKGQTRNICFPSEAAMAADIVIGHVVGATAGLEAALTGKRCVLINPYNMLGENIELFKKGDVLYEDIGKALDACKEYHKGNVKYQGLGDWSPFIDLFDPFRDGKSAYRLRSTLENIMDPIN